MSWIDKILPSGVKSSNAGTRRATVPEGLWKKCIKCESVLYIPDLERNQQVCPKCGHHMRIGARRRLDLFLDADGQPLEDPGFTIIFGNPPWEREKIQLREFFRPYENMLPES